MSILSLNAQSVWKWEQNADPFGTDVNFTFPNHLADDWLCTSTGPIKTICFAYSWKDGIVGEIVGVDVQFWSDEPDPDGPGPLFSKPGTLLWEDILPSGLYPGGTGTQGWYDPWTQVYLYPNHTDYYKRQVEIPDLNGFTQTSGTIYWICLSVIIADPSNTQIGWKTTLQPWNDEAVYNLTVSPAIWNVFPNPPFTIRDLAFRLSERDDINCPVELSSFNGTYDTNLCQINWVTESETNVQGYNIYRNTNNLISTATKINLGMISANNTTQTSTYQFQDTDVAANQTYYYWLESNDYDGATSLFGPINISTLGNNIPIPVVASNLSLVYPNPARSVNPSVNASIKDGETAVLSIYNLRGQLVTSFNLQSGNHKVEWNRMDNSNHKCADGVYFYRLITPTMTQTRKVLILN